MSGCFLTALVIVYRDSASGIQVPSNKGLTVWKSQAKNMEDEKEMAGMLHQDVSTFSS
jgi:hypothetical protein